MGKIERLKHGVQLLWELLKGDDRGDMPTQRQFSEVQKASAAMVIEPKEQTVEVLPVGYRFTPFSDEAPWVGLTDDEIEAEWDAIKHALCLDYKTWAKAIEAKLKEKNSKG